MKKVLSTVAALGLVAGLATTASAVEFKMSGNYLVEGAYLSNSYGAGVYLEQDPGENTPSDAYFMHTFEIKPTMKVNDKVSMSATIRVADDTFWGSQAGGDLTSNVNTTAGTHNDFYVHHLYMDYASPIGKMRFGRTPAGPYGTSFMDPDSRGDRVMLWPSFLASGPWSTLFFLQKSKDTVRNLAAPTASYQSDADNTKYVARVYYKTDSLDSGLSYEVTDDQTGNTVSDVKQALIAYGKYKMDNYFANVEVQHFFGSKDYDHALVATADQDYDSWGGMLEIGAKVDALTPSLMYFYGQGQQVNENDIENHLGTAGTGDLFEPLYILTGRHTGMLNNDVFTSYTTDMSRDGVHAVVAAADYAVSNQLTLHGAIGWAKADEVQAAGQDDEYGWEYNIGAAYKLLDNLTYEAHFGYLDTGDYFRATPTTDNTENVYILTHSLTMTF